MYLFFKWNLFCCYSPSYGVLEDEFWSNLIGLTSLSNPHWIRIGYFNEALNQNENKGGLLIYPWNNKLKDFMDSAQAIDLGSSGLPFT